MWLFSNKGSDSILSSATALGLSFTCDVVPGFAVDPSRTEALGLIDGPYHQQWRLVCGYNKKTKEEVTLFSCTPDVTVIGTQPDVILASFAKTVKWMKTLRHPNILTWIAGTDLGSGKLPPDIRFVTEGVIPLREYLRLKADSGNFNLLSSWGIHQVAKALVFLNEDGKLAHNAVRMDAVFVSSAGEWKLGGLDFVGPINEPPPAYRSTAGFVRPNETDPYYPPDGQLVDSWGLGCLIWELFNPNVPLRERNQLTNANSAKRIPKALISDYRRLVNTIVVRGSPKRCTVSRFLNSTRDSKRNGFLANDYVDTLLFLEEIQLKSAEEKNKFFIKLTKQVTTFPDDVCRHKILPHLINGLRYGSAGIDALIPVLRLIPLLVESDFQAIVLPCLLKLFATPERVIRVRLLEQLPNFVEHLTPKLVESQIFNTVSTGFTDSNPIVREATVRAMISLAPKLSGKLLNETLTRHLILLQTRDEQGGIRTNCTVCLAKLAPYFSTQTIQGPVLNALLRATRDTFVQNRQTALTALAATQDYYTNELLSGKILPCLSFLTIDPEKSIRDGTFRIIRDILDRLERVSENLDLEQSQPQLNSSAGTMASHKASAAASALTQWAMSALSFSSRLMLNSKKESDKPQSGSVASSVAKEEEEKLAEAEVTNEANSKKLNSIADDHSSEWNVEINEQKGWNDDNLNLLEPLDKTSDQELGRDSNHLLMDATSFSGYDWEHNLDVGFKSTRLDPQWDTDTFFDNVAVKETPHMFPSLDTTKMDCDISVNSRKTHSLLTSQSGVSESHKLHTDKKVLKYKKPESGDDGANNDDDWDSW